MRRQIEVSKGQKLADVQDFNMQNMQLVLEYMEKEEEEL